MKILIDTHVFLWGLQDESKLSLRVQKLLPVADVWISVAALWEIVSKVQIEKLKLPVPVGNFLTAKLTANGVSVLPLTFDHVKRLENCHYTIAILSTASSSLKVWKNLFRW